MIQQLCGVISDYNSDGSRNEPPSYTQTQELWRIRNRMKKENIEHELMFSWNKNREVLGAICIPDSIEINWIESHPSDDD